MLILYENNYLLIILKKNLIIMHEFKKDTEKF